MSHLGSGKGCGHFEWRSPAPSRKVAAFGASNSLLQALSLSPCADATRRGEADIDGTLIQPQGGRKYPKNDTDWQWLNPHVVPKLRKLHADGCALDPLCLSAAPRRRGLTPLSPAPLPRRFAIVLFSNQGLKLDNRINYFKRKMPLVARALDIPLRAFAAFDYNEFRKPAPGMWLAFEERFNGAVPVGASRFDGGVL